MLRTAVIIDYQNMHITGSQRFWPRENPRKHRLHPLKYAETLLSFRNSRVPEEALIAALETVEVYRGLPSSELDAEDNARNLADQERWSRDPRVKVIHRALKYVLLNKTAQHVNPQRYVSKEEKGIDVLCALAVVRNAAAGNIDLVILASHDSDLEPAIEEAVRIAPGTKVETASWFNPEFKHTRSKLNAKTPIAIWNTALGRDHYLASSD